MIVRGGLCPSIVFLCAPYDFGMRAGPPTGGPSWHGRRQPSILPRSSRSRASSRGRTASTTGAKFRLEGHRSRATPRTWTARTSRARRRRWRSAATRSSDAAGHALRAGPLVGAARVPGDGRGRQGRRDQARDVGRQSAGLPGVLVQGADDRGARPRLPVALHEEPARARAHRHLQPQLLRGSAGGEGAPGVPRRRRSCRRSSSARTIWDERYEDIRSVRALPRRATARSIRKFFLHVSRDEQKKRFLERIERAGEELEVLGGRRARARALGRVHGRLPDDDPRDGHAASRPWYVVPADNKWFTRLVVAAAIVDALASLDLHYPKVDKKQLADLAAARKALLARKEVGHAAADCRGAHSLMQVNRRRTRSR